MIFRWSSVLERKQHQIHAGYSLNDAVYMFTMMSGTPEQYIHFKDSGIDIKINWRH